MCIHWGCQSEVPQKLAYALHQATFLMISFMLVIMFAIVFMFVMEVVITFILVVVIMLVVVVVIMFVIVLVFVVIAITPHHYLLNPLHTRFVSEPWFKAAKPRPSHRDLSHSIFWKHIEVLFLPVAQDHVVTVRDLVARQARIPRLEFMVVAATVARTCGKLHRTPGHMAVDRAETDRHDWKRVRSFG